MGLRAFFLVIFFTFFSLLLPVKVNFNDQVCTIISELGDRKPSSAKWPKAECSQALKERSAYWRTTEEENRKPIVFLDKLMGANKSDKDHYSTYYRKQVTIPLSRAIDGFYLAWVSKTLVVDYQNIKIVLEKAQKVGTTNVNNSGRPKNVSAAWKRVYKIVLFVLKEYETRRVHWSPEFLMKLLKIAKEYLAESTYITIYNGRLSETIKATLRVIREKNGFVPMEKYLRIKVDVGDKVKNEPGNFAISREISEVAWPEIMMQLSSAFVRSDPGEKPNHYITYADSYSKRLYTMLGFKPIPLERITLEEGVVVVKKKEVKNGVEIESYVIVSDGIEWTPMEADQGAIDSIIENYKIELEQNSDNPKKLEELKAIQNRQKNLEELVFRENTFESRELYISGRKLRAEVKIVKNLDSYNTANMRIEIFEIQEDNDWHLVETHYPFYGALLPFAKGTQYSHTLFLGRVSNPEEDRVYTNPITFQNGKISVRKLKADLLSVDTDRKKGESLDFRHREEIPLFEGDQFELDAPPDLSVIRSITLYFKSTREKINFEF